MSAHDIRSISPELIKVVTYPDPELGGFIIEKNPYPAHKGKNADMEITSTSIAA